MATLKSRILTSIANTSAGEPYANPGAQQDKWAEELALAFVSRGALVNLTSVEPTTTGIGKKVPWDASVSDTDGFWAVSPNPERLTIPVGSGITKVRLSANITWATNSSGTRIIRLLKNGLANVDEGQFQEQCLAADSGVTAHSPSSAILEVVEGDYFEAEVTQTSGGALNLLILSSSQPTWFQIEVVEA